MKAAKGAMQLRWYRTFTPYWVHDSMVQTRQLTAALSTLSQALCLKQQPNSYSDNSREEKKRTHHRVTQLPMEKKIDNQKKGIFQPKIKKKTKRNYSTAAPPP